MNFSDYLFRELFFERCETESSEIFSVVFAVCETLAALGVFRTFVVMEASQSSIS